MEMIQLTRIQLMGQLRAAGFVRASPRDSIKELNVHAESWPMVKAALLSGLHPNLAVFDNNILCTK